MDEEASYSLTASKVNLAFVALSSILLALHPRCLLLHLIKALDIGIVSKAAFTAEPLANREDTTRLDKLVTARPVSSAQLAGHDVVSLKARQACLVFEPFSRNWTDDCLGTWEKLVALPAGLFGADYGVARPSLCLDSTL